MLVHMLHDDHREHQNMRNSYPAGTLMRDINQKEELSHKRPSAELSVFLLLAERLVLSSTYTDQLAPCAKVIRLGNLALRGNAGGDTLERVPIDMGTF